MSGNTVVVSSRRFTQVSTAHFLAKSDSLMGVSEIIWCQVIGTALYIHCGINMPSAKKQKAKNKTYYEQNKSKLLPSRKQAYQEHPEAIRAASRASSKASYDANPEGKRAASCASSKASYDANPEAKRAASRAASKATHDKNPKAKIASPQAYYADNKESMCAKRRGKYALAEPKPDVKDMYLQANLLGNSEARVQLMKAFKKQHETLVKRTYRVVGKTACRLAASRLLNKA